MATATWIGRTDLRGLACPYCGHRVHPDTDWVVAAQQSWGRVGVALSERNRTIGLLLLAPLESERAALLTTLWVAPSEVHRGHGRRLVQAGAAGLLARDVHAILARGARVKKECARPPVDFLKAVGFARGLDDQLHPASFTTSEGAGGLDGSALSRLYRLDLDQTVADRPSLFEVLGRWVGSIRPIGPEPAGRVSREG